MTKILTKFILTVTLLCSIFILTSEAKSGSGSQVKFMVNMRVQILKGNFNPSQDTVYLLGTLAPSNWTVPIKLTTTGDSIYSFQHDFAAGGDTVKFKFRYFDLNGLAENWESVSDREYIVPTTAGITTYTAYFNNDSVYTPTFPVNVYFSVNMELERLSGRFDPGTDTVSVNGTFNGWSPKHDILSPSLANPDIYEGTVAVNVSVGDTMIFKFWYTDNNWESVSDRKYGFSQANIDSGYVDFSATFNNGSLDNVINQTCIIKFTVNTVGSSPSGGSPFPNVNSVHLAGSALPLQWPNGGWPSSEVSKVIALFDDGTHGDLAAGDHIFSKDITFPAYTILDVDYKYSINFGDSVHNGGSNDNEAGFGANHSLHMTKYMVQASTIDTFGTMGQSHLTDLIKPVPVTFSVNMSVQALKGNFNPLEDTVYIAGSFNGDAPNDTLWDADHDSIYSVTLNYANWGDTVTFKFMYKDHSSSLWQTESISARSLVIPELAGDYTDFYNSESTYTPPPTVLFKVNMKIKALKGTFNPSTDIVFVSGTFNGWGETDTLKDANNDSVYTISLQSFDAGDTTNFKFRYYDMSESAFTWENGISDRVYVVPSSNSTYEDYFDKDSTYNPQHDIAVTFSVNMELERLSGRFDPATDTVSVNGTFNGWSPKTDILEPSLGNPDIYEKTVTIHAGLGDNITFKFWYTDNNWESVSDRVYTFTQQDVDSLSATISKSFNDGTLDNVLNQTCTIKFTVNTVGASPNGGSPFPNVNTVHVAGSALPLQWPGGGWPASDLSKMNQLFDDGTHGDAVSGDHVFSADLTFPAYTVLTVQYKYSINFGDTVHNGGSNDNEAGFAANHTMTMTKFLASATAVDTFGHQNQTTLINFNGVGENSSIQPKVFNLSQNYPNPFNPSTTIKYDLAVSTPVVLTVYDMLGRSVETMVNNFQQAGTYSVTFSSASLPSGLYYYRIVTNTFTQSKTMLYVK